MKTRHHNNSRNNRVRIVVCAQSEYLSKRIVIIIIVTRACTASRCSSRNGTSEAVLLETVMPLQLSTVDFVVSVYTTRGAFEKEHINNEGISKRSQPNFQGIE